jgi:L-arabinokinase
VELTAQEPVPTLLRRVRNELAASFDVRKPTRIARAPGRLDVMGGIADYTGSVVCEATLDRAAAVAVQRRDDRDVQVIGLNLLDQHLPFTLVIPLESLALPIDELRRNFAEPGRTWAGYLAGCLAILHDEKLIDLRDPAITGFNIALYSTVPLGAGVSSSAAIEVAMMTALVEELDSKFQIRKTPSGPMKIAAMCQRVENQIVGAPCGIMDQAASCAGEIGSLMRMKCQPHELLAPLHLPAGVRAVGINSNVKHSVGGGQYGRTRCAAFMGHKIILEKMKQMGGAGGQTLVADPMNGYLANLPLDDYKRFFRPYLPETIRGGQFLLQYGPTIDKATTVEPDAEYRVQGATDHHVFEAHRVNEFIRYIEEVNALDAQIAPPAHTDAHGSAVENRDRKLLLDKAGHLMYASHISYTNDALLGADECDLLVALARAREPAGIYGAKITGGGSGGTVAILCNTGDSVDTAISEIMHDYEQKTGLKPEAFLASSQGAWAAGTAVV